MPRRAKKNAATGDCYDAAAKYILGLSRLHMGIGGKAAGEVAAAEGLILVHAEVMGQGPMEGVQFGHGFVVDTKRDVVIDKSNGRNIQLPRALYYAIAQIEEIGNYHEYTPQEMMENMIKYRHYGPWDLKTSSGL
jgi:hypothetical protein